MLLFFFLKLYTLSFYLDVIIFPQSHSVFLLNFRWSFTLTYLGSEAFHVGFDPAWVFQLVLS